MNLRIRSPRSESFNARSSRVLRRHTVRLALAGFLLLSASFAVAQTPGSPGADNQSPVASSQLVQLEGELEILFQDLSNGHSRALYSLKQADGTRIPLQFAKNPPTHLLTGDHVIAGGQLSGASLLLYSGSNLAKTSSKSGGGSGSGSTTTTSSIPVPNTFGVQSVLVILVNFQDDVVEPYTVADAQAAFFGTGNSATNFILENSYGQTWLTGTVVGWYTIPVSVTTCDTSAIATDAQNAATAAGVSLSNYGRYVYLFPQSSACGFAGASTVGGNPSQGWLNGTVAAAVVNHELGHALGLWHSHSLDCGASTVCSSGTIVEYGDNIDTMGYAQGPSPDYNAFQKERLGWLNYGSSPTIQTVTTSGTYTIYPYENSGPGPNALKVLQSTDSTTGAKTWYYLESRQAIGFDSFLTDGTCAACYTQNETTGILFHLGTDGDANSSLALAMTPANPLPGWFDDSLVVGLAFADSTAGVAFTTESVTSTGATVNVQVSGNTSSTTTTNTTTTTKHGKGH